MKKFYLIAFALFRLTVFAADDSLKPATNPQALLQDLQQKMASVSSVYLELTQERHLKLFSEPLKSEGVMLIESPDRIRWETTAPYQAILLGDKKSVAQFEFSDGKWEKLKMGFPQLLQRVMQQMSLMNQGKLEALTNDYAISVATGDSTVMTLTPKGKSVREMLASLEVKMASDFSATREVTMNEPNGDFTRIRFHDEKRNVKFPAGTFDQTKPLAIAAVQAVVKNAP
ncbi:MAG TPA: outer membrane lipoprotein carrier protein LolA [Verrucomicrobiae bacterium]|nr:outer membrane lipoprotein carrier protein LolA [Verrucomicrobiae bacterium]